MNKIKYSLEIGDNLYVVNLKSDSPSIDDSKIFRYAKSSIGKKGFSFTQIVIETFKDFEHKCPFCFRHSAFEVKYSINRKNKKIKIKGIELLKDNNGLFNYHCKSGKNSNCTGSMLNPNSIEYVSVAYKLTKEKANELILKRNKSPFYKNNFSSEEEYRKSQSRGKDWYIQKYGREEGEFRYNSFCNLMKDRTNRDYLIKKLGIDGYRDICSKKANCNLEFFIKKFGEPQGTEKWESHIKKISRSREKFIEKHGADKWVEHNKKIQEKKSLEYFISIHGEIEGRNRFYKLRKSYSFTKEDYINKYGVEKWIEKITKPQKRYSKEANRFFELLIENLKEREIICEDIKTGDSEFFLWDNEFKRIYFYDFFARVNGIDLIIEYDHSFWHSGIDGSKYSGDVFQKCLSKEEKINYDERKKMYAKYKGFNLITCFCDLQNPLRDDWKFKTLLEQTLEKIEKICKN